MPPAHAETALNESSSGNDLRSPPGRAHADLLRLNPDRSSELIATPERGLVYGNRGCLHDTSGRIRRQYAVRRWIACRLEFKGWQRGPLLQPGKFSELFFLDEATALAAGHRPCALCRRSDYGRLTATWRALHPGEAATADAIVELDGAPWLVLGPALRRWTPGGYTDRKARPARATMATITPPTFLKALPRGWTPLVPFLHPSAG